MTSVTVWSSGCVVILHDLQVTPLDIQQLPEQIDTSLRVHTSDGHVLLFPAGVRFSADSLHGDGQAYGLNLDAQAPRLIQSYPLDEVEALESLSTEVDKKGSFFLSGLGTVTTAGVTLYILYAIALSSLLTLGA